MAQGVLDLAVVRVFYPDTEQAVRCGLQKGGLLLEDQTGGCPPGRPTTGDLIRMVRERQKMSARALSAKANLSPSYVGKVESGEIEPSLKAFGRIALALHLSRQEIWLCVVESVR